jgi:hypothetical protein
MLHRLTPLTYIKREIFETYLLWRKNVFPYEISDNNCCLSLEWNNMKCDARFPLVQIASVHRSVPCIYRDVYLFVMINACGNSSTSSETFQVLINNAAQASDKVRLGYIAHQDRTSAHCSSSQIKTLCSYWDVRISWWRTIVICDVTPCSPVHKYQHYRRTCCLHLSEYFSG